MSTGSGSPNVSQQAGVGDEYRTPSGDVIKKAGEVTIHNAEAKSVLFKSLYNADNGQRKRVMIIFIRHFFCGVSPPDSSGLFTLMYHGGV